MGIVPVSGMLDLKALAAALGGKKAEMAQAADAERSSGYVVGGISPIGQRKALPTALDETADLYDIVYVSGGRRGLDIGLAPADLARITNAVVAPIAKTRVMESAPAGWDYAARIAEVKARIHVAEAACGRAGAGVRLLVATKAWGPDAAAALVRAGGGSGRCWLARAGCRSSRPRGPRSSTAGARIHVIGQLQRNKAATAVRYAQCVQTVDSLALAERLSRLSLEAERDLDVMIQVNVSGEDTKAGVTPASGTRLGVGRAGSTRAYGDGLHDHWAQLARGGARARGLRAAARGARPGAHPRRARLRPARERVGAVDGDVRATSSGRSPRAPPWCASARR